jgi:predicted RNase H-like HicB family nuclease
MYKKYQDSYVFPASIEKTDTTYGVHFQDLPGCVAIGDTMDEVIKLAKESLALHLWGMESDNADIPPASSVESIKLAANETLCLLDVNMFDIRSKMDNRAVKKTLTIPWSLNEMAEKRKINFSQVLQSALRERLGASDLSPYSTKANRKA